MHRSHIVCGRTHMQIVLFNWKKKQVIAPKELWLKFICSLVSEAIILIVPSALHGQSCTVLYFVILRGILLCICWSWWSEWLPGTHGHLQHFAGGNEAHGAFVESFRFTCFFY